MKSTHTLPLCALAAAAITGCAGPMERSANEALREQMLATHRAMIGDLAAGPVIEIKRPPSEVEDDLRAIKPDWIEQLDKTSAPDAIARQDMDLGPDLLGEAKTPVVQFTLKRAIELAVRHNLDLQSARLTPAIGDTLVTQAEARFDAVYFADLDFTRANSAQAPSLFDPRVDESLGLGTGLRKTLVTGGVAAIQTDMSRSDSSPAIFTDNPSYASDVLLSLSQPLLRNFGSDVNRADILLAQSSRQQSLQDFKSSLLSVVGQTEAAYWNLVLARQNLLIQQWLYQATVKERKRLKPRLGFDVKQASYTDVLSREETRRTEVIRARAQVRKSSDALKRLINDPQLPLSTETLVQPLEAPVDAPVQLNMVDAIATALRHRPELQSALMKISDSSIRQSVAENLRLPRLDISGQIRLNGVANTGVPEAYDNLTDGDYVDYILGLNFEVPLGNRAAQALYRQRQLERQQAVSGYQSQAQGVVLEIKDALRELLTGHELIGATRAARRAAAENLRSIEAEEDAGVTLSPDFIDLKLNRQQALAAAEQQEIQALTNYNTAIAQFYFAMGTLLERNGIDFQDPAPGTSTASAVYSPDFTPAPRPAPAKP